jgi:transcription antitermination factor NusG
MNRKVVLKREAAGAEDSLSMARQPFLHPEGLFEGEPEDSGPFWSCVRTRPRWEKKFAEWLRERGRGFFLPVFRHETVSGRKRRTSELPLFPGFVFVEGDLTKKDFAQTGSVAYVLRPRGPREAAQLHRELRNIWCGLTSGLYVAPVRNLAAGEICRIARGPLQGVEAKFERMGREGRLVLQVEMMGGGIAVEIPANEVEVGP